LTRNRKLLIAGVAVLAVGAGGVGIAQAVGGDDEQATGPDADRAAAAAVKAAGGGRATEVEHGDDGNSAWEVEVRKADGSQVEVRLDSSFKPLGTGADDDGGKGEDESGGDDD
jgi:hypothetical protein